MRNQHEIADQYKTADGLSARIALHERFSTNPQPWMRWVFAQFQFPPGARILELGAGVGKLWSENADRVGPEWRITLSDFSPGMLAQARAGVAAVSARWRFEVFRAEDPPFPNNLFDAVIANHMLYHVGDLDRTIAQIHRVLKPGGWLYASTNGEAHLRELDALALGFDPGYTPTLGGIGGFTLQNGEASLLKQFGRVELRRYPCALEVTESAPMAAFVLSSMRAETILPRRGEFEAYAAEKLRDAGGRFHITKDSGLFLARKNA